MYKQILYRIEPIEISKVSLDLGMSIIFFLKKQS